MMTNIILPLFRRIPHLIGSFAPNACDVNVSYARLAPIIIERPTIAVKVVARPAPAVIAGLPSLPMKYMLIR